MYSHNPAEQFNSLADFYESMMEWPFRKKIELPSVKKLLGNISGLHVLDFGCGSGFYTRLLSTMGAGHIVGYDASEGMLNYCRRNISSPADNIEYISTLDGQESKFDIVLAVYVLPYARSFAELCSMVSSMVALLKPSGRLVTLPLSPFFDTREQYYAPYGFTLSSGATCKNGEAVTLRFRDNPAGDTITAWFWSQRAINDALLLAGLDGIRWSFPRAEDNTDLTLNNYIENPHTLIIEGVRVK